MKSRTSGPSKALLKVFNSPIPTSNALHLLLFRYQTCYLMLNVTDQLSSPQKFEETSDDITEAVNTLLDDATEDIRSEMMDESGALDFDGSAAQLAETMSNRLCEIVAVETEHLILDICEQLQEPRYWVEVQLAGFLGDNLLEKADLADEAHTESNLIHFPVSGKQS